MANRYKTLAEINVALGYITESVKKLDIAILGERGLIVRVGQTERDIKNHLENCEKEKEEEERIAEHKNWVKDKLWIGVILLFISNLLLILREFKW